MDFLKIQFIKTFGEGHELKHVISPLRICPLGAHVDHQNGLVTGMTLDANIEMTYSSNEGGFIRREGPNIIPFLFFCKTN